MIDDSVSLSSRTETLFLDDCDEIMKASYVREEEEENKLGSNDHTHQLDQQLHELQGVH
jgi:hypothetical protein